MNNDSEREAFEAWLGREAFTERSDSGKYTSAHVDAMWTAWLARASTPWDRRCPKCKAEVPLHSSMMLCEVCRASTPAPAGEHREAADALNLANLRRVTREWHEQAVALGFDGVNAALAALSAPVGPHLTDQQAIDLAADAGLRSELAGAASAVWSEGANCVALDDFQRVLRLYASRFCAPVGQSEAVAWRFRLTRDGNEKAPPGWDKWMHTEDSVAAEKIKNLPHLWEVDPLYTHPAAAREPLTPWRDEAAKWLRDRADQLEPEADSTGWANSAFWAPGILIRAAEALEAEQSAAPFGQEGESHE